jgi:hypothetical protein
MVNVAVRVLRTARNLFPQYPTNELATPQFSNWPFHCKIQPTAMVGASELYLLGRRVERLRATGLDFGCFLPARPPWTSFETFSGSSSRRRMICSSGIARSRKYRTRLRSVLGWSDSAIPRTRLATLAIVPKSFRRARCSSSVIPKFFNSFSCANSLVFVFSLTWHCSERSASEPPQRAHPTPSGSNREHPHKTHLIICSLLTPT